MKKLVSSQYLPPPPRRVRGGPNGGIWFGRIFMLPHTLIGIGAAGYLLFLMLWCVAGTDVPGNVIGANVSHSSKHGNSYTLTYQFIVDGQTKQSSDGVKAALYQQYQSRTETNFPVTVHYLSIGVKDHARLCQSGSLWSGIGGLAIWAGGWNLVVGAFIYYLWVKPLRARWLYRHGEATSGTLLKKRERPGKSTTYYVSYSFQHPYSGATLEAEIEVWDAGLWQLAREGQQVTVLYSRDNPKRSTLYEFGGYKVVDA